METVYEELRKRHGLPAFALLDREFEISSIEDDAFLLRGIRGRISDKIDSATKILDDLLHPDASFSSFREANVFEGSDRESMICLYKRFMFFKRSATELSFDDSDELNAAFIKSFVKEWPGLKKSMISYVRRLKDSWQNDITKKEVVRYLG